MIRKSIRKIFQSMGYELIPIKPVGFKEKLYKGEPFKLEFVGPSGVGKTTVTNFFINSFRNTHHVISREELKSNYPEGSEFMNIHNILLDYKIKNISNSPIPAETKIKRINYYEKVIKIELRSKYIGEKELVVLDEGIIHNFAPELIEIDFNKNELSDFFRKKLICFCGASEDYILKNLAKRDLSALQLPGYSEEIEYKESNLVINNQIEIMTQLKDKMKKFNFPFIELDLEKNPLMMNLKEIKDACLKHFPLNYDSSH